MENYNRPISKGQIIDIINNEILNQNLILNEIQPNANLSLRIKKKDVDIAKDSEREHKAWVRLVHIPTKHHKIYRLTQNQFSMVLNSIETNDCLC